MKSAHPEVEVFICDIDYGFAIGILFTKNINGKRYVAKPTELEFIEIEPGSGLKSTLEFDRNLGEDMLTALAKALDNKGIKTDNDFKIQGLLEAQKAHLEDMRSLVFKKEKTCQD